jgi:hypothetical protein
MDKSLDETIRRQIEEAQRSIREDWPEWMRRNRDAVHIPIRTPKANEVKAKRQ